MTGLVKLILGMIFVYIGIKIFRVIKALYNATKTTPKEEKFNRNPRQKINIKKEDIIDADFEEIEPDKTNSNNSKQ